MVKQRLKVCFKHLIYGFRCAWGKQMPHSVKQRSGELSNYSRIGNLCNARASAMLSHPPTWLPFDLVENPLPWFGTNSTTVCTVTSRLFFCRRIRRVFIFTSRIRCLVMRAGDMLVAEVRTKDRTAYLWYWTAPTVILVCVNFVRAVMEDNLESGCNPNVAQQQQGCGPAQISVHISPTTGGDFYLAVEPDITVENLKKLVSKKLKVPRDRICLLFREKWVSQLHRRSKK